MLYAVEKSRYEKQDFDGLELVNVDVGLELNIEVVDQLLVSLAVHLVNSHLLTAN